MLKTYYQESLMILEKYIGKEILEVLKDRNSRVYRWTKYGAGIRINLVSSKEIVERQIEELIYMIVRRGKELKKELKLTSKQIQEIKDLSFKKELSKYLILDDKNERFH